MAAFPDDLLYTREHTWARVEDTIVTIGITDYAQENLGEIVSIELYPADASVKQGEPFGVIESDKASAELISPVSGDIISVNDDLYDDVGILECDHYDTGWMIAVDVRDLSELDNLLDAEEYEDFVSQDVDED